MVEERSPTNNAMKPVWWNNEQDLESETPFPHREGDKFRDLDLGMNKTSNTSFIQARVWGKKIFQK